MFLLDTDTVSHHQYGHEQVIRRIKSVPPGDIVVSTITLAEQMRGCWNAANKARTDSELVSAYDLCRRINDYYSRRILVDFTQAAAERFHALRQQGIRIGTQDLRIAAIALTLGATVVSSNLGEFRLVPGLLVEDWTVIVKLWPTHRSLVLTSSEVRIARRRCDYDQATGTSFRRSRQASRPRTR